MFLSFAGHFVRRIMSPSPDILDRRISRTLRRPGSILRVWPYVGSNFDLHTPCGYYKINLFAVLQNPHL